MLHEDMSNAIKRAASERKLLESAAANIHALLAGAPSDLYGRVVEELVAGGEWDELNDRFYQTLEFGTGGLRGRTIGKIVTKPERGETAHSAVATERPQFPCVGTNAMNFYNVSRGTQGLVQYIKEWNAREKIDPPSQSYGAAGRRPSIVIAHDPRFFSKEFTDLAARVAAENGCDAYVFDGPRSTPELSFAVRHLNASAGIVITASHNPPHDNGYKVYFSDGGQVVEPHAGAIIAKVNAIKGEAFTPLPRDRQGAVTTLGRDIDEAYMRRLETLILDRPMISKTRSLRIIFPPLQGTGGVILKPMLDRLGFTFEVVAEQDRFDGRFPTVKSPNPENPE